MPKGLIILLLFFTPITFQNKVTLEIQITELKNSAGKILLELLDENENSVTGVKKEIVDNKCIITIAGLFQGNYLFKYFHDENNNEEIDVSLIGIPKEGYGFSNNAKGTFGPPKLKKMVFKLSSDTTMICKPLYIKK